MNNGVWFATVCFKEWEVDLNNLDINDDSTPIYEHIRIYGFCHEFRLLIFQGEILSLLLCKVIINI